MNAEFRRVKEIFLTAVEKLDAAERDAYLHETCGQDEDLRRQVNALLNKHIQAGSFLESPAAEFPASHASGVESKNIGPTVDAPLITEAPGTVIGPYKLLQQIGEGGMGTVFMAEQTEPVKRKVALKIIKPGMDSRQVIARFEAERQALAMMDHVNIARVFDGGTTAEKGVGSLFRGAGSSDSEFNTAQKTPDPFFSCGRPYFVMELVHGVPITKYCDDNHLTPRERLELFVPVCQAIQHAHQKGIIHRDIKPSNVMVTLYDGKPVPKVIDFGVAKATEQKLTERTLFTQYGTMVGTLEYMSPEQAEMSALGVDTRSDIYSLGVLLYELLTGSTPLTRQRMKEAAYAEILRMIKEEEPPKPSTRLSDSGEALASISAQRKTEPAKLTKLVRGELDWIVMRCLEKDRNRRYETANGFAADVQRYLSDEPVLACPPSVGYRLRKFVRRNKAAVAMVAIVAVALVAVGATGALAYRNEEQRRTEQKAHEERLLAEQRQHALEKVLLAAMSGDFAEAEKAIDQAELLGASTGQLRGQIALHREGPKNAAMHHFAGVTLSNLGMFEEAVAAYRRAIKLQPDFALAHANLGVALGRLGRHEEAITHLLVRKNSLLRQHGPDHVQTLNAMNNLAWAYVSARQFDKAVSLFEETLEQQKVKFGPDDPGTVDTMAHLAGAYSNTGKADKAVPLYEEALERRKVRLGPDHPDTLNTMHNLGCAYQAAGRLDKAVPLLQETVAQCRARLGPDHPETRSAMHHLAVASKSKP